MLRLFYIFNWFLLVPDIVGTHYIHFREWPTIRRGLRSGADNPDSYPELRFIIVGRKLLSKYRFGLFFTVSCMFRWHRRACLMCFTDVFANKDLLWHVLGVVHRIYDLRLRDVFTSVLVLLTMSVLVSGITLLEPPNLSHLWKRSM